MRTPILRATLARLAAVAALLAALPLTSHATLSPQTVRLRQVGPAPVLRAGESATVTFEFEASAPAVVSGLDVTSRSLKQAFARPTAPLRVSPSSPARFTLELLPSADPAPLVVTYEVDGKRASRTIDLMGRMEATIAKRSALTLVEAATSVPASPRMLAEADSVRRARSTTSQGGTIIFFSGRLTYTRPGNANANPAIPPMDMGAHGVRVSLMDEDYGPDDELASTFTGPDGSFHHYYYWDGQVGEGDPELYLHFETDHPWVVVQEGFWDVEYSWDTATRGSSTADVHVGTYRPSAVDQHPALHIATNIARGHVWYDDKADYFVPGVDVKWPDGPEGAWFDPTFEQIHIGVDREWSESTQLHEYGHYFVYTFAGNEDPSYCNGFCDQGDCGHCLWCPEGSNEAFSEGWADWISQVQTNSFMADYGVAAVSNYDFERVQQCGLNGVVYADAEITEGNFAGTLLDVFDSGPGSDDDDPNGLGTGTRDRLQLGFDEIITVLDVDSPRNSRSFLNAFVNRYPQHRYALWETAMNNRWNLDASPPGAPSNVTSSSHPIGTPTPNVNVSLAWTLSSGDDWSGVRGYSIAIAPTAVAPDDTIEASPNGGYTSPDLAAGTWYATVRTVDVSGRVSSTWATYGPFIVVQPTPVDLVPYTPAGWYRPIVARPAADATVASAPYPSGLTGNAVSYISTAGRNAGQSAHTGLFGAQTSMFVDGTLFELTSAVHPDAPGATYTHLNRAVSVRGGRHMVGVIADAFGMWWEGNEVNNYYSMPYVWGPLGLAANTRVRRMRGPPKPDGSWSGAQPGFELFFNCDGMQFTSSGFWNAVWLAPDADSADYSIRLHQSSITPTSGFDYLLHANDLPAGYLEAVLVNRNTLGQVPWNVGVIDDLIDTHDGLPRSSFVVKHVTSTTFPFADTLNVAFPDSEYVVMKEVFVPQAGPVSISVWADSSGGPVHVSWLDRTYTRGALDAPAWTWPAGRVTIEAVATASGYHCVVLHRDPKDGRLARTVQLGIGVPRVNLQAFAPPGWAGAAVPRPAADATTGSVIAPDTLHGGTATTHVSLAYRNASSTATTGVPLSVRLAIDGALVTTLAGPVLAAGGSATHVDVGPYSVAGGRHMLTTALDPGNLFDEASEADNVAGEQWVWSPPSLTLGGGQPNLASPPDPVGGFASYTGTRPLHYNCLGFRASFPAGSGLWGGVGLAPVDSTDSDLRLHATAPGTRDAFGASLATSSAGPYDSDYLIVRHDGALTLDASVIRGDDGAPGGFDIGSAGSVALSALPVSTTDQSMGTSSVLRLHSVRLPAGYLRVRLVQVSGLIDWGVSLHGDSVLVQDRSQAIGSSWLAGASQGEEFIAFVPAADTFVVAVWKRGGGDRGKSGVYRLQIDAMALDAPGGDAPRLTRLSAARPAPFRDRTSLSFELAAAGEARLEVFDLRGARVRTLSEGLHTAGRHEIEWRADDDRGRPLPAGVYLVRLQAGSFRGQQKVVRVE